MNFLKASAQPEYWQDAETDVDRQLFNARLIKEVVQDDVFEVKIGDLLKGTAN